MFNLFHLRTPPRYLYLQLQCTCKKNKDERNQIFLFKLGIKWLYRTDRNISTEEEVRGRYTFVGQYIHIYIDLTVRATVSANKTMISQPLPTIHQSVPNGQIRSQFSRTWRIWHLPIGGISVIDRFISLRHPYIANLYSVNIILQVNKNNIHFYKSL